FPVPLGAPLSPENLHGLATGTGGAVLRTQLGDEKLDEALKRCEEAFAAPIFYPTKVSMPAGTGFYPAQLPPPRSDSPTLVVGRVKAGVKELTCKIEGTLLEKAAPALTLTEKVAQPELDNYFLISMVSQWKNAKSEPAMIRADRALALAFEQTRLEWLDRLAGAQLAMDAAWSADGLDKGKLRAARQLFEEARQLKPHDKEAEAGIKIVRRLEDGKLTPDH